MEYVELIKKQATVVELDPAEIKKGWRARQDYGVIIADSETLDVDEAATADMRSAI